MKPIVYFDMDGVLADFEGEVEKLHPGYKELPYNQEKNNIYKECIFKQGFFRALTPVPGAVDAFNHLAGYVDAYILSTPVWVNPDIWGDKRIWVEDFLGEKATQRLILSHHKNLNRGDVIIDDNTFHGVDKFEGTHIHFGTEAFPDWGSVLNWFSTDYGVPPP